LKCELNMNYSNQDKCSSVKMYPVFGETYRLIVNIYAVGSKVYHIFSARLPAKRYQIPEDSNAHGHSSDNLRLTS
jgi:hypothetical protein